MWRSGRVGVLRGGISDARCLGLIWVALSAGGGGPVSGRRFRGYGRACAEARALCECSALEDGCRGVCEVFCQEMGNLSERWSDGEGAMVQEVSSQPHSLEARSNAAPGYPSWLVRATFRSNAVKPVKKRPTTGERMISVSDRLGPRV